MIGRSKVMYEVAIKWYSTRPTHYRDTVLYRDVTHYRDSMISFPEYSIVATLLHYHHVIQYRKDYMSFQSNM